MLVTIIQAGWIMPEGEQVVSTATSIDLGKLPLVFSKLEVTASPILQAFSPAAPTLMGAIYHTILDTREFHDNDRHGKPLSVVGDI
jgi:hypothetical protein